MRIDLYDDEQLERDFAWAEANIGEAGQWHTHPNGGRRRARTTWTRGRTRSATSARSAAAASTLGSSRPRAGADRWNSPQADTRTSCGEVYAAACVRARRRLGSLGHGWWVVSIRSEQRTWCASPHSDHGGQSSVRAGTVLAAKDHAACEADRDFFIEAALGPRSTLTRCAPPSAASGRR